MGQTQRVQGRSTSVFTDDDGLTKVVYHHTPVVAFDAERIILNTGGYATVTTKLRMNQAANQYALGYQVYQKDHAWYVVQGGKTLPFEGRTITLRRSA